MTTFTVNLSSGAQQVHIGTGILSDLGIFMRQVGLSGRIAVVTDTNVAGLFLDRALDAVNRAQFRAAGIQVEPGEGSKSLAVLEMLYTRMLEAGLTRQSAVVALGGGVVGDVAGFAAATLFRGIALVQVPTSLLAQVDSALGGKTGINHPLGKNLIGAFHQPRLIVADVELLRTLPERLFREGLAEVVKYAAIADAPMFEMLENNLARILARDQSVVEEVVVRCLRHKAKVVEQDEREAGLRKILNFGHTVGHALEAATDFQHLLHGEAVAIGMVVAARLSCRYAGLAVSCAERIERWLSAASLPTRAPRSWRSQRFRQALGLDKKRTEDGLDFVLLNDIGKVTIQRLSFEQVLEQMEMLDR